MGNNLLIESEKPVEFSTVCSFCQRLFIDKERACEAYTKEESIPLEIWDGNNPHIDKFKGDNGLQFKPKIKNLQ